ncbi:MAG: hypothetical protein ACU836_15835 [Gammaproteobacteria bacterium]
MVNKYHIVEPETAYIKFVSFERDTLIYDLDWRENPQDIHVTADNYETLPLINNIGFTAKMQVRENGASAVLFTLTDSDGLQMLGAQSPNIRIIISDALKSLMPPREYEFDAVITDTNGISLTRIVGIIEIKNNITS